MEIKIMPKPQSVIRRTTTSAQGEVIESSVEHGGNRYTPTEWALLTRMNALEQKLDELLERVAK